MSNQAVFYKRIYNEIQWKLLLETAIRMLDHEKIKDWSFGEGTALSFFYNHRNSKDIDIFLHDVRLLTKLTPRLNDYVENKVDGYSEMSNFLKLKIKDREIDFIVAPFLTKSPVKNHDVELINGRCAIAIETPWEIAVKKIFYRAESFKSRDVVDLAEVIKHNPSELRSNIAVYRDKLSALEDRLKKIEPIYLKEIERLEIYNLDSAKNGLGEVFTFLHEIKRTSSNINKRKQ